MASDFNDVSHASDLASEVEDFFFALGAESRASFAFVKKVFPAEHKGFAFVDAEGGVFVAFDTFFSVGFVVAFIGARVGWEQAHFVSHVARGRAQFVDVDLGCDQKENEEAQEQGRHVPIGNQPIWCTFRAFWTLVFSHDSKTP
jgi:hypothetical protein